MIKVNDILSLFVSEAVVEIRSLDGSIKDENEFDFDFITSIVNRDDNWKPYKDREVVSLDVPGEDNDLMCDLALVIK